MDMMELRRRLMFIMAGSGVNISPWKMKKITVPSNMSTSQDILSWLQTELTETYTIMMCCRDNLDLSTWATNDFIMTQWAVTNVTSNAMTYQRNRGDSQYNCYLQSRNFSNNEPTYVYQNETFTVFYQ